MTASEKSIQNAILRAYGTRPDMRVWRANAGVGFYGDRTVAFGVPGQADLTGILPAGVRCLCPSCGLELITRPVGLRLECEIKSASGRQTPDQRNYQAMIERMGGIYVLARSVEDVRGVVEPILKQGI